MVWTLHECNYKIFCGNCGCRHLVKQLLYVSFNSFRLSNTYILNDLYKKPTFINVPTWSGAPSRGGLYLQQDKTICNQIFGTDLTIVFLGNVESFLYGDVTRFLAKTE